MKIFRLNEQFAQSFSGDGYNSSNGVFKVSYRPYADLSISVGRNTATNGYVSGEEYQIGDTIRGIIRGTKKKVTGQIIALSKNEDSTEFRFKVKSSKTNKVYNLISASIERVKDIGYVTQDVVNPPTSREKMQTNLKYGMGNMVWRSLESEETKNNIMITKNGTARELKGVIDPEITIKFINKDNDNDLHRSNFSRMGIAYLNPDEKIIYVDSNHPDSSKLKNDHLAAIEAHEIAHELTKRFDDEELEVICDLLAAKILRNKGYNSPYKIVVSNFLGRHGKSYGEALDKHTKFLQGISY